jgi:hypothetical protein
LLGANSNRAAWTDQMKTQHAPFVERQVAGYRNVLSEDQRVVYDANVKRLLDRWRSSTRPAPSQTGSH